MNITNKPSYGGLCVAVLLGVLGYLCAIFLTILAGYGLLVGLVNLTGAESVIGAGNFGSLSAPRALAAVLVLLAVLRGVLHYGEQYCNHFIA